MAGSLKRGVWVFWSEAVQRRRGVLEAVEALKEKADGRQARFGAGNIFRDWSTLAKQSSWLAGVSEKVSAMMVKNLALRAMIVWENYVVRKEELEDIRRKVALRAMNLLMATVWVQWDEQVPSHNLELQLQQQMEQHTEIKQQANKERSVAETLSGQAHELQARLQKTTEKVERLQTSLSDAGTREAQTRAEKEGLKSRVRIAGAKLMLASWERVAESLSEGGLQEMFGRWADGVGRMATAEERMAALGQEKVAKKMQMAGLVRGWAGWAQEEKVVAVQVQRKSEFRTVTSMVGRWREVLLWREEVEQSVQRMQSQSQLRSLREGWDALSNVVMLAAASNEEAERRAKKVGKRLVEALFAEWASSLEATQHLWAAGERLLSNSRWKVYQHCLLEWKQQLGDTQKLREVEGACAEKAKRRSALEGLRTWQAEARRSLWLKGQWSILDKRSKLQLLAGGVDGLEREVLRAKTRHDCVEGMLRGTARGRMISDVLNTWSMTARESARLSRVEKLLVCSRTRRTTREAMDGLGLMVEMTRAGERLAEQKRAASSWRFRRTAIREWAELAVSQAALLRAVARMSARNDLRGCGRLMRLWMDVVYQRIHMSLIAEKIAVNWASLLRTDAFQNWLEAAEESALVACHWRSFSSGVISRQENLDPLLWLTDAAEAISSRLQSKESPPPARASPPKRSPGRPPLPEGLRAALPPPATPPVQTPVAYKPLPLPPTPVRSAAPPGEPGRGLARFRKAGRAIIMARRLKGAACRIGMVIDSEPPYVVKEVTEVVDCHGNLQGTPNYTNENVLVGDVMRYVDGACIDDMPFEFVKEILFGPPNSIVRIRLRRGLGAQASVAATRLFGGAQPGDMYEVTVRRHTMITLEGIRALHESNIAAKTRKAVGSPSYGHTPEEPNKPARRSESPDVKAPSPTYNEWDEEEQLGRRNANLDAFLY
mmetsp:Transcript_11070/g.26093  ORF Transcript_11070/g.26093 Transcript_11070/m.26093 type:complete len:945 (-) Transcript_11070:285-3119(-)